MIALRFSLAVASACCLTSMLHADEKVDGKLLVGRWEVTRGDPSTVATGCSYEFGKNGDLTFTYVRGAKSAKFAMEYSLDGAKLTSSVKDSKGSRTVTIKKLTENELVWEEQNGKSIELTRKK